MSLFDELGQDLRYTLRALRRDPALVAGIVVTFALAIGANAAMVGLVGRLLLSAPNGVREPDRVARVEMVFTSDAGEQYTATTTSFPAFRALSNASRAFSAVAAVRAESVTVGVGAETEDVAAVEASGQYFPLLGTQPVAGRFFGADDDVLPSGSPVVVLSYAYWHRHFAGDRDVVGRNIELNGRTFSVIGVAPRGFTGHDTAPVDVFVPLTAAMQGSAATWISEPHMNVVGVIARLRDGVAAKVAEPLATTSVRATWGNDEAAQEFTGINLTSLLPGRAASASPQGRTALWLSGVALIVLLIAVANAGTLLLLRALRRRREIAVRIALGVSRARLARQLLAESVVLALAGGAAGLLVAHWLAGVIRATLLSRIAAPDTFVDGPALIGTALASCVAGLLAGGAPLVQLRSPDVIGDLTEAAGTAARQRFALRRALVGLQVALCTVLLVGAGLFVRSLQRLESQDLGFSTSRLLFVDLSIHANLAGPEHDQLYEDMARRVATLPGVTAATIVQATPFGSFHVPPISVPGLEKPPNVGGQLPMMYASTPDYLRMMGVTLRAGRLFGPGDVHGSPMVVLVNETMARGAWPGQNAVGRCIRIGFAPGMPPSPNAPASLPCREVVGVVRDSRVRSIVPSGSEARLMQYYVPFGQLDGLKPIAINAPEVHGILVQTAGDPSRMIAAVQRQIQSATTVPTFAHVRPYQELIDPQLQSWRLGATLFTAFGALALAIAAVGLFGVISYVVAQRTREIGVRLALGGTGAHVGRVVIVDAVRMVGAGIVGGLVVAVAAAPLVQSMLFQTSPREAAVLMLASAVLLGVTVLAAAVPAWRAMRVSPLTALRAAE